MKKIYLIPLSLSFMLWSCGGAEVDNNTAEEGENDQIEEVDTTASDSEEAVEEVIAEEEIMDCESFKLFAYLSDPDDGATNVRKSPGGDVLTTLAADDDCELTIDQVDNGWFRVIEIFSFMEEDMIELPGGYGWIHGSVIGLDTRNYGGQDLKVYSSNNEDSDVVGVISDEKFVRPKNACGKWIQIEYEDKGKKVRGWIQEEWLCGSPVTTCS